MEEGYFSVEVDNVSLTLSPEFDKEIKAKAIISIVGGLGVFRFTKSSEETVSTDEFTFVKQSSDNGDRQYLYGFSQLYLRSNYIELNSQVLSGLVNAVLSVKLVMLAEAAPAAPAKGKGAPAPVVPSEELLVEYAIPFHRLLSAQGGVLQLVDPLSGYADLAKSHTLVNVDQSTFSAKVAIDNNLAGFVLGARYLSWESATLTQLPHTWALHAPDVLDPKAKVQPTAADLRNKYIENIGKLLDTQAKVANFTLAVGGRSEQATDGAEGEDSGADLMTLMSRVFPSLELRGGKISWNRDLAVQVPVEEDIRMRGDLWSVQWAGSSTIFLHRSEVRKLTERISNDPTHAFVPMTVRKVPTPEAMAAEGGEVFATGLVDLSGIIAAGEQVYPIGVSLQGDLIVDSGTTATIVLQANAPLVTTPTLKAFATTAVPSNAKLRPHAVSAVKPNRDAVQELRDEIAKTLERIGQEYVSLFPNNLHDTVEANRQSGDKRDESLVLDEQKLSFMKYLVNNGLFHDLQESLRPKVQLLVRERYGPRGRALGKSAVLRQVDTSLGPGADVSRDEATIQAILSELYAFLMQECNAVLNSMFARTVIQKEKADVENPARVLDLPESYRQVHFRLLREADDCLADGQYYRAELLHLERLQNLEQEAKLREDHQVLHDAYLDYARFLLHYAAEWRYLYSLSTAQGADALDGLEEHCRGLLQKAREALSIAVQHDPLHLQWETLLLFGVVLAELEQREAAGEVFLQLLATQRGYGEEGTLPGLDATYDDFSGYESDQLVPVHPRIYAVLAGYFALTDRSLEIRKALLMANRSYTEGSYGGTSVSTHGQPRRTIVLILAETAQYLVRYGAYKFANQILRLASESERSATEKAIARDKPALTPPYIKYMLCRAEAEVAWSGALRAADDVENDGTDAATQAALLATDSSIHDAISAHVSAGFTWFRTRSNNDRALHSFLQAIRLSIDNGISIDELKAKDLIPLRAFILAGKLLLQTGEWLQASKVLLFGSQVYTSSALCLLLGIAYLRMEKFDDAEHAILEANVLNNRQPDSWAYLCLLCIQRGSHRYEEAEAALFQSLRLQLADANLMRELATSFMAIDKLQIAEDLIRRTIALESQAAFAGPASTGGGFATSAVSRTGRSGASAYNRKLLADILAGQNLAAKAIEEYQGVLQDAQSDHAMKLQAAQKCSELLATLGRQEELPALQNIIAQLSSALSGVEGEFAQ